MTRDVAFSDFLASIGMVTSCVTTQRHVVRPSISRTGRTETVLFPAPGALRGAHGGRSGYFFDFRVVASGNREVAGTNTVWRIGVRSYEHRLLDNDHRELLVYHWQPDYAGPDYPHLHVSASLNAQFDALNRREIDLDKRHLATGQVPLAAFVRMLITEFAVMPLRQDWEERLQHATAH